MHCGKCGASNPRGAAFCNQCGAALGRQTGQRVQGAPPGPQPRRRGGCVRWAVLGILAFFVLAYIVGSHDTQQPAASPAATAEPTGTPAPDSRMTAAAVVAEANRMGTSAARPSRLPPARPPSPVPTKTPIPTATPVPPTETPEPTWTPEPPPTPEYAAVDPDTGLMVTATKFHADIGDAYFAPKGNDVFAVVHLRIDNTGSSQQSYNEFDFKLQGDDLVKYPPEFFDPTISNSRLGSGYLTPGESVAGDMAFEVPGGHQYHLLWSPNLLRASIYVPLHK